MRHSLTTSSAKNEHKALHKTGTAELYNPYPTYAFTGSTRPVHPLSARRTVPKSIPHPEYAKSGIPSGERYLNRSKVDLLDAKGQEAMRKVSRLAREVLDIVAAEIRPGVTTDYLDEICHKACLERDVSSQHSPSKFVILTLAVISVSIELRLLSQVYMHLCQ